MTNKRLDSKKNLLVQIHEINNTSYQDVWDFQTLLHDKIKQRKRSKNNDFADEDKAYELNHIVFCEHFPVYTLGKSADVNNLLLDDQALSDQGFEIFKINRGGDITYHGPGQITGYYIMNLELLKRDVHWYVRSLEQIVIDLLKTYDVDGVRLKEFTGVWVKSESLYKKVCAIGVHLSRWVSMHGFGFNINSKLDHFKNIVPCGIQDENKSVTSLSELIGRKLDMAEVKSRLIDISCNTFALTKIK